MFIRWRGASISLNFDHFISLSGSLSEAGGLYPQGGTSRQQQQPQLDKKDLEILAMEKLLEEDLLSHSGGGGVGRMDFSSRDASYKRRAASDLLAGLASGGAGASAGRFSSLDRGGAVSKRKTFSKTSSKTRFEDPYLNKILNSNQNQ